MRTLTMVALLGGCVLAACGEPKEEVCDPSQDTYRCKGNAYQSCSSGGCMFGVCLGPHWLTTNTCAAPQVCKIGTITEVPVWLRNGCFAANSSCAEEGATTCAFSQLRVLPVDLWTCSRSSQDQSLQWSLTRCDQRTPPAICLPDSNWSGEPPPTACYEIAGTCPPSSRFGTRCEGNVVYSCSGPTIVNGKAVLDWVPTIDCTPMGRVCRVPDGVNADCVIP